MTIIEKLAKSFADKEKILFSDKEYLITDGVDEHCLELPHESLVGVFWTDGNHFKRTMMDNKVYIYDNDGFWKYIKLRVAEKKGKIGWNFGQKTYNRIMRDEK